MQVHNRPRILATITLVAAVLASVSLWFAVIQPRRLETRKQFVLSQLPPFPAFERQNQASIERFREADRRARRQPLSTGRVGGLGMLYHAYQFVDEARRSYGIARQLEPNEFRWAYYWGVLEKAEDNFRDAEPLIRRATELRPESADAWAELGDLLLKSHRQEEAKAGFSKALELDPLHPLATLGQARLAMLSSEWQKIVDILLPLLGRYPRLSKCHKYLSRAYGELGRNAERERHQALSEYGSAAESALMEHLHGLSIPAILNGDPTAGPALLEVKCARCHTQARVYDTVQSRRWWARTVRRMQRLASWDWLTDEEAASVTAYLASRGEAPPSQP
jgi:tetratricopeptide (TPR) repeat protein